MKSTKKYFLMILAIVFVALNALIFLITYNNNKEAFNSLSWWLAYAMVMLPLVALLIMRLANPDNERKQSVFLPLMFPLSLIVFIAGISFLFFTKIPFMVPLIILIVFAALIAIGFAFGFMYKDHLKTIEVKEVKVIDMEGLILYLDNLTKNGEENVRKTAEKLLDLAMVKKETNDEIEKLEKRIFEITYFMDRDFKENKLGNFYNHASNMEKLLKQRKEL